MKTFIPASPLPYRASHNHINAVSNGNWYRVATISGKKHTPEANMQNATFIAIACNSHAELVGALENLLSRCNRLDFSATHDGLTNADAVAQARAVLAKVNELP